MTNFKVGDKLRCINSANYVYKGEIVTVKRVDEQDTCLDLFVENNKGVGGYWVSAKNFELLKGEQNVKKFKIGDIVRATDEAERHYSITKDGWTGEVTDIRPDAANFDVRLTGCNGYSGTHWVCSRYFDLVSRNCSIEGSTESFICSALTIKQVIFNEPATIVIWSDDVKTVVKCGENEQFDPEKGLAMCVAKRAWGNKYDYFIPFKKYCSKYQPKKIEKPVVEEKPVEKKPTVKKTTKKPVAKNRVVNKTITKKTTRKTK